MVENNIIISINTKMSIKILTPNNRIIIKESFAMYLCICIFVFVLLTHGNIIFYILAQSSFQKYTTCWVFLAIHHMLYLCICVFMYLCICIFVFALLTHGNTIFDILAQSSFHKYISCWVFLALSHMLYLCMCVFVSLCICVFVCV